jgi:SAM-dependent methyltransferase
MAATPDDRWAKANAYEAFMGRWGRRVAESFVHWLGAEPGLSWLDVGCGTGALTSVICHLADPRRVVACDPAAPFVEHMQHQLADPRVTVVVAGDGDLPANPSGFDRVVSSLVLNFLPDPRRSVEAMRGRARPGGVVAATVWDYAGRMEFLRVFWDEVIALDPAARELDEGARFPVCRPDALESVFDDAGMRDVRTDAVEVPTRFESFADYWEPFLGGTGPAPSYIASLSEGRRTALRDRLERRLSPGGGQGIELTARAWVVRGTAP